MKSLLIITRQPPTRLGAREALDLALAAAAFGVPAGMLFMGDGVLQLLSNQDAALLKQKSLAANLQALSVFGIEELLVCQQSLAERGLTVDRCLLAVKAIDKADIQAVVERYDQVVSL